MLRATLHLFNQAAVVCDCVALRISGRLQATPANWPNNHESIDAKGWAFLLPTVTPEDADKVRRCMQYAFTTARYALSSLLPTLHG